MVSGILQLMFNAVDIIVVGRFSRKPGACGCRIDNGTSSTCSSTCLWESLPRCECVCGAVLCSGARPGDVGNGTYIDHAGADQRRCDGVCGRIFAKGALELMDTPADVIDQSALYMRIYFMGMPFSCCTTTVRRFCKPSATRSGRCISWIVSGVINAGLNMFLVIVFQSRRGRCGDCNGGFAAISCVLVLRCLYKSGGKLSAPVFETVPEKDYIIPDFPGRHPGGYSEYRHQLLERAAAVIRQFLRFDCNGRLHGGQQCAGIFIHLGQLRHPGVHELHKPELRCRKIQTNG